MEDGTEPASFLAHLRRAGLDEHTLPLPDERGTLYVPEADDDIDAASLPVLTGDAAAQLKLGERIGGGGMGQIFRARQVALEREVAVKRAVGARTRPPRKCAGAVARGPHHGPARASEHRADLCPRAQCGRGSAVLDEAHRGQRVDRRAARASDA